MKVLLMHKNRDFDPHQKMPANAKTLERDLGLDVLFAAMAQGDEFLQQTARTAVLSGFSNGPDTVLYRQAVLKDCINNPGVVRDIYSLAVEACGSERKLYLRAISKLPGSILYDSRALLLLLVDVIKKLRNIADQHHGKFSSEGFSAFFAMIRRELDDEYLAAVLEHLERLEFRDGILVSAELGAGNAGANYVLRKTTAKKRGWLEKMIEYISEQVLDREKDAYTLYISDRDESGARALEELSDRGINHVANALAQSADHVLGFFNLLRAELAFYVGCLNLRGQLASIGARTVFPLPEERGARVYSAEGLYDVCLALLMKKKIVGNRINAAGRGLVVITGANQGGKSTFLRSVGLAQLMLQCGMFAPAEAFTAGLCDGLFTHFKREEDAAMKSGKLDEELMRMNEIVELFTPEPMVLFNESFSATNEREGSEIAGQIVRALVERKVRVFFVTHLYEFARSFHGTKEDALFLRAERRPGGKRTFKLIEAAPLQTSYGRDLYDRIFNGHAA